MTSFTRTFVAGQNEPFGLLSPQDLLSGYQYTFKGSQAGDALMRERDDVTNKKNDAAKMEEVTDDENSNLEDDACPICMDAIDPQRNCVTTECGHRFHAKCLFANIAHNGFDCPCCRGKMAEVEEDNEYGEFDEEEDFVEEEEEEDNTDHLLRGMRWLFQRATNGIVDESEEQDDDEEEEEEELELPNVDFIVEKLTGRGITFEHVIKTLLNDTHPEYSGNFDNEAGNLFGAVRSILVNYARRNQEEV
jgi:hypothetical protein